MANYPLCTGQQLNVTTKELVLFNNITTRTVELELAGLIVRFDFIKSLMKPEDANDLEEYIEQIEEANDEALLIYAN